MSLPVADQWFEVTELEDGVVQILEPHVDPWLRANTWLIRGSESDLLVDTGLGIGRMRELVYELTDHPVHVVLTHAHADHVGGLHEFDVRIVHRVEAPAVRKPPDVPVLLGTRFSDDFRRRLAEMGEVIPDVMVTALPEPGFDPTAYRVLPATPTRLVEEGTVIDLGDREFEIIHLAGHTRGSLGLWEEQRGILFVGDVMIESGVLDEIPGSDVGEFVRTMRRLLTLPARIVHSGHDPSFGQSRLVAIATEYLAQRAGVEEK